jgi:hypothetical protein
MVVAQTLTGAHSLSLNIYRNAGGGTSYVTDGAGVWLFLGNTVPDLGSLFFRMTEPGLAGNRGRPGE